LIATKFFLDQKKKGELNIFNALKNKEGSGVGGRWWVLKDEEEVAAAYFY
jgi:hypothetical protein